MQLDLEFLQEELAFLKTLMGSPSWWIEVTEAIESNFLKTGCLQSKVLSYHNTAVLNYAIVYNTPSIYVIVACLNMDLPWYIVKTHDFTLVSCLKKEISS